VTLLLCVACDGRSVTAANTTLTDNAITVGSFDFAESELLAELYSQAMEAAGLDVVRAFQLGPRELVAPALETGLVELVPEYAGTALSFVSLGEITPPVDPVATHQTLLAALRKTSATALEAAPAQDTNALVVTQETASALDLRRISDLARAAPRLTLGGPPECPERPRCLAGLEDVYGLRFAEFLPLDAGGARTRSALRDGYVDVAVLFTTDPVIVDEGWVELEDDRGLQPAENVTPIVRREVVERWGDTLVGALDAVSRRLTTEELRTLNRVVDSGEQTAVEAARQWLAEAGVS